MKKLYIFVFYLCAFTLSYAGGGISGTSLDCGVNTWSGNTGNGTGSDPTVICGGGQCCYSGSDLDGDGCQDVRFSIENYQSFEYTIPGDPTDCGQSIDITINTTANLQGALFNTTEDTPIVSQDEFGSSAMGSGDFTLTGTGCGGDVLLFIVDGYGGTTGTFSVDVSCPPPCSPPTSISAGTAESICEGGSVTLSGTFSGGDDQGAGTYQDWSDGSVGASATVSPTTTTTYTYMACNAPDGDATFPECCVTDNVTVTVTPLFVPNAGADATICNTASVTIGGAPTGPAGSTYSWACAGDCSSFSFNDGPGGGASTANPIVTASGSNGDAATYTVTVTNGPCVITDEVIITIGLPIADAGIDATACAGDVIAIGGAPTGPAGFGFTWSEVAGLTGDVSLNDVNLSNPSLTIDPTSAGGTVTLRVLIDDGAGCTNTDDIIITIDPLPAAPTASATPDPSCGGDNVTLAITSSTAGLTFEWYDAATGGNSLGTGNSIVVTPAVTTTYYVEAIDATTLCIGPRGSIVANVTTTSVATAGADASICLGEVFNLNGSISNVECTPHTWSASAAGAFGNSNDLITTFTPTSTGNYTLTLTPCSSGSCPPVASTLNLIVNESPTVIASSFDQTICTNIITDLTSTTTGGTPNPPTISTTTFTSTPVSLAIPDGKSGGSPCATTSVSTTLSVSGAASTVDSAAGVNIEVCVSTTHTRNTDLQFQICSPGGAVCQTVSGSASNCFNISNEALMENFEGASINGTWTITVTDCRRKKTGNLTGFSIDIDEETYGDSYTTVWTPSTGVFDDSSAATQWSTIGPSPSTAQKIVTSTDNNGCTGADTLNFIINDCFCNLDTLRISYAVAVLDTPSGSFTQYKVFFSELAQCSTIQPSDFELYGTDLGTHSISSISPLNCSGTPLATDSVLVTLSEPVYDVLPDVHIRSSATTDVVDAYVKCPIIIGGGSNLFAALPFESVFLTGENIGSSVKLNWVLNVNNDINFYEIKRSKDGKSFSTIGTVSNDSKINKFNFVDENPLLGKNYYKISINNDSKQKTTNTISLNAKKSNHLQILPNPIFNTAEISFFSSNDETIEIVVFDVLGKKVFSMSDKVNQGKNNFDLDLSKLSKGNYSLSVEGKSISLKGRIVKK